MHLLCKCGVLICNGCWLSRASYPAVITSLETYNTLYLEVLANNLDLSEEELIDLLPDQPDDEACGKCPKCNDELPFRQSVTWLSADDMRLFEAGTVLARKTAPAGTNIIPIADLPPRKH
jgi:hypothetical protein